MRCEDVLKQLTAFSSGDLPADGRRAVQAHLAQCPACRTALAEIDALAGVLAGAQAPPVPVGFASRVLAAAQQRHETELIETWNLMRWWRMASAPMHAAAAAVLVIGLSVGLVLGWTSAPSPAQAESVVQGEAVDAYQIDYLGEAPSGSLADSYLTLVLATNKEGR
jgi:anti-sigma factor RsiW